MFPNIIRQSPTILKYSSPTGTSTPAQIVKQNCKLKGTETAKDGSQVQRSELQNPEVKAIINNVPKGVTNDTFKAETESSNVPCNKLKSDLNISISFQNMSNNGEDMDMEEVPNAETNPPGAKTPAQVASCQAWLSYSRTG